MPVYEYECGRCGAFEHSQSISDQPLARCPNCGSRKVKRLISASSFQLKGGGWYSEGYQKGSGTAESPSAAGASGKGSGAAKAGTEDKAAGGAKSGAKASPASSTKDKPKTSGKPGSASTKTDAGSD